MNDLHVLVTMNLRNASSEHVVSSLGKVRHPERVAFTISWVYETNNLMPQKKPVPLKSARKPRLEQANTVLLPITLSVKRVQPRQSTSRGIARNGHTCQGPAADPRRPRRSSNLETGQHLQGGACKAHWSIQRIPGWKDLLLSHQPHETLRVRGSRHGKGPQEIANRKPARSCHPGHFSGGRIERSNRQRARRVPDAHSGKLQAHRSRNPTCSKSTTNQTKIG